jgi:hypothetical protein
MQEFVVVIDVAGSHLMYRMDDVALVRFRIHADLFDVKSVLFAIHLIILPVFA